MAQEQVDAGILFPGADQFELRPASSLRVRLQPWWMLVVISILSYSSSIDRGAIALLVNPIKTDLGISDVQMGLLMGSAITIAQCLFYLPAGHMVDTFNRRIFLGCSVFLWSSISALTGFAGSFAQLFGFRAGLAGAEAGMMPAAHSLIRDAFPPERRGIAFSVYLAGAGVSPSLSLLVCGTLIALGDSGFFHGWPILGHFKTWQIALAVPGICTLPLALILLTVHEPKRRVSQVLASDLASTREALGYLWRHKWVYGPFFVSVFSGYANGAFTAWLPTSLIRGWGLPASQIAHISGSIGLVTSVSGAIISGLLMDQVTKRNIVDGALRIYLIAMSIAACCNIWVLHVHETWLIYTLLGLGQFFLAGHYAALSITLAYITPSRMMGRMTAFYFLTFGLLGGNTWSPTVTALVAKHFYPGPLGIVSALNTVFAISIPITICLFLFAVSQVQRFHRRYPEGLD